jgi:hypothetical protein
VAGAATADALAASDNTVIAAGPPRGRALLRLVEWIARQGEAVLDAGGPPGEASA